MAGTKFIHQQQLGPVFNAVTMAAERTSSWFKCEGFNQLVLTFTCTRNAYTALAIELEFKDQRGTVVPQYIGSYSAGTTTLTPNVYSLTTSSSVIFDIVVPICHEEFRVVFNGTGGGASDLVTAYATVAVNV
jgi:hypothetical protein